MLSDNSMGLVASNIEGRKFERWEHSSDATVVKNDGRYITFIVDKDVTLSPVYRYKVVAEPNEFTGGNTDVSMAVYGENPYYQKVTIDNVEVTVNVTANSDGTLTIDIPADYLKTLSNGEYILRIDYTDGYAETTIKVSGNVEEPVEKPTTPTNPTPPTEPTTPTNPAYPTEPTTPTNPTTPSNPITSAKPAATTTTQIRASSNSTNAASATSVRTGDSSQIYLWTALCIMALIVITGSVGNMSKKYRRNK